MRGFHLVKSHSKRLFQGESVLMDMVWFINENTKLWLLKLKKWLSHLISDHQFKGLNSSIIVVIDGWCLIKYGTKMQHLFSKQLSLQWLVATTPRNDFYLSGPEFCIPALSRTLIDLAAVLKTSPKQIKNIDSVEFSLQKWICIY